MRLGLRVPALRTRGPARTDGPRIALIGNCQAAAMASAMRLMRPDAAVDYHSAGVLGRRSRSPGAFAASLDRYDHVFAQPAAPGRRFGPAHLEALAARHPGYAPAPSIVFAAFHPDLVYVEAGERGALSESPVGHYHSALALYGFLAGLSPDETERLFDAELFERLGYLDLWTYAADTLLELGRAAGLDLGEALARWTRRGLFMHSTNHPRLFVLADLAATLLGRAGLPPEPVDADSHLVDDLAPLSMWPVYGAVARRYGVPASELFMTQRLGRARRPPRVLRLRPFIEESFALYARTPRGRLRNDRVDTWLASDDMRRLFAGQAGRSA